MLVVWTCLPLYATALLPPLSAYFIHPDRYISFRLRSALSWQLTLSPSNVTPPAFDGWIVPLGILQKSSLRPYPITTTGSPPSALAQSRDPTARQRLLTPAPCPRLTLYYSGWSITSLLKHQLCPVSLLPYYFQSHSQQKPSFALCAWDYSGTVKSHKRASAHENVAIEVMIKISNTCHYLTFALYSHHHITANPSSHTYKTLHDGVVPGRQQQVGCTETAVICVCLTQGYNNSLSMANNREVIDTLPIVGPACSTLSCPNSSLQHVTINLLN